MLSATTAAVLAAAAPGCFVPGHFSAQQSPPPPKKAVVATADSVPDQETDEQAWRSIAAALGKSGDLRDGVFTVVFPRADLDVTFQGNDVPPAAGIQSDFRFYRCTCGMINVIGQFVVADYEANDVIDALRQGRMEVASVGPLLLHERPRLLLVRFQGESHHGADLGRALRDALSWTGPERLAPQKIDPNR
jgi:hypothetical protein